MERERGFEPPTSTLARLHSTTELFPLEDLNYHKIAASGCQLSGPTPTQHIQNHLFPIPDLVVSIV